MYSQHNKEVHLYSRVSGGRNCRPTDFRSYTGRHMHNSNLVCCWCGKLNVRQILNIILEVKYFFGIPFTKVQYRHHSKLFPRIDVTVTGHHHMSPSQVTDHHHMSPSQVTDHHHMSPSQVTGHHHMSPSQVTGHHHMSPSQVTIGCHHHMSSLSLYLQLTIKENIAALN